MTAGSELEDPDELVADDPLESVVDEPDELLADDPLESVPDDPVELITDEPLELLADCAALEVELDATDPVLELDVLRAGS